MSDISAKELATMLSNARRSVQMTPKEVALELKVAVERIHGMELGWNLEYVELFFRCLDCYGFDVKFRRRDPNGKSE